MQKIILDTNVLVSSLIQRSYPFLIVNELFTRNNLELCVSDALMSEYYEVLKRRKFSKYPDFILRAETLLADIERKAVFPPNSNTLHN
ncbi:putative toxin-antitoxin system toxin component, PIN family [Mucilaginibacter sp. OK098]|uniref:putative toxin-antitoxin system toxin component, PIN family n=1 Tax=Mucilaginibacter sp. OK098 TaxID=1855297 RepID=UPI0009240BDD|nr:putative toxin-antitoxin system toxin component, PIN family [Mucilaginibacter sp. OK098]